MVNMYTKTVWEDQLIDTVSGDVIQRGTRFTAQRANNFEDGIENLYSYQLRQDRLLEKLEVQLELIGRSPINNGSFYDSLEGETRQITLETGVTTLSVDASSGDSDITVLNSPFSEGQSVVIYDNTQSQIVRVTSVAPNTISITPALSSGFSKGANVARTNAKLDTQRKSLQIGDWGTYSIAASEVI